MKAFLLAILPGLSVLPLYAQTATTTTTTTTSSTAAAPAPAPVLTPPAPNPMMERMLSSLTPEEKNQILSARTKALADNPGLQTDEMGLMEKGLMLQSGAATDSDKEAFRAALKDYRVKLQAAMLKADPTIQPVLDKIEAEGRQDACAEHAVVAVGWGGGRRPRVVVAGTLRNLTRRGGIVRVPSTGSG